MTPSDAGMSRIANIDEEHKRHFCGDPWHRVGQGPPQPYPPATVLGPQFANSGWSLTTTVAGGPHTMVAYAYSVVSQTWHAVTSTSRSIARRRSACRHQATRSCSTWGRRAALRDWQRSGCRRRDRGRAVLRARFAGGAEHDSPVQHADFRGAGRHVFGVRTGLATRGAFTDTPVLTVIMNALPSVAIAASSQPVVPRREPLGRDVQPCVCFVVVQWSSASRGSPYLERRIQSICLLLCARVDRLHRIQGGSGLVVSTDARKVGIHEATARHAAVPQRGLYFVDRGFGDLEGG